MEVNLTILGIYIFSSNWARPPPCKSWWDMGSTNNATRRRRMNLCLTKKHQHQPKQWLKPGSLYQRQFKQNLCSQEESSWVKIWDNRQWSSMSYYNLTRLRFELWCPPLVTTTRSWYCIKLSVTIGQTTLHVDQPWRRLNELLSLNYCGTLDLAVKAKMFYVFSYYKALRSILHQL